MNFMLLDFARRYGVFLMDILELAIMVNRDGLVVVVVVVIVGARVMMTDGVLLVTITLQIVLSLVELLDSIGNAAITGICGWYQWWQQQ